MPAADARAFWITGVRHGEIRGEPLPPRTANDVMVRTLFSGVSRGTEALVFAGAVPASEHARMRAPFQAGDFPAPVKYGYCSVGAVEAGPAALLGRTVFCLYPHQTRYVVPAAAVHLVPDGVPPARAVLAANLETAVNCLWDAQPKIGDRVAVVGAGTLGCLLAWLAARIPGSSVELVDVDERKAAAAQALGVVFKSTGDATRDADVVLHASGTADGLATALELAGFESLVLEASWFGDRSPEVPLGAAFHSRRLTLKSSQVGVIAAVQRSRWTTERRMRLALSLLADSALDALITGESKFEELPAVLGELASGGTYALCHRITYS
jgi:2-desacetyl-2-hydroxyethyl bacteriochlorophyllide A dehydrogenase